MNFIRWFDQLSNDDVPLVGGKNASLGEMYRQLTPHGINIPNGFAITSASYRALLDSASVWEELHALLDKVSVDNTVQLAHAAQQIRKLIVKIPYPEDLRTQIIEAYHQLVEQYGSDLSVAVRSSATAEDLPNASFAGQHDSYLNIQGEADLLDACMRCYASLFTERGIHYRINQGFDHFKVDLSICVMKMVRSDLSSSGVMFTLDTESGFNNVVFITAAYGLGENVVQGTVDPDEFYVHKSTFSAGFKNVLKRSLGKKKIKMIYAHQEASASTKNIEVEELLRNQYCIADADVLSLTQSAIVIEKHYSERAGQLQAMDIEWAKDGIDGKLYIVQARPETVVSQQSKDIIVEYELQQQPDTAPLVVGRAVGEKIANGKVRVIRDVAELKYFETGEVLVSDITTPDWGTVMKQAAAIVTNRGGRTCHAAIVARELGIPAVVGTSNATQVLKTGDPVTVSCNSSNSGHIYSGILAYDKHEIRIDTGLRPQTKIMMNLANPDMAFHLAGIPNDGVGLARLEFIINESIKVHPMALLHFNELSASEKQTIQSFIEHYDRPEDYFIDKLVAGIATIAAAFYPKPVIVRLSDFKSNEYASLIGGQSFEPVEENPMIGFRGASRYIHESFKAAFDLECEALRKVRDEMGFRNVKIMLPFCRRVEEARRVIELMQKNGLQRQRNDLQIYMMCEIPNNILLMDEFSHYFDGFSIGSNDLTQLTLGVDRDSELLADDFDERDPGVLKFIEMAIKSAQKNHKYIGICGQAPSDYPDFAQMLVTLGIDSISLNPDCIIKTTAEISQMEKST